MTLAQLLEWLELPAEAMDGDRAMYLVDDRVMVQLGLTADGEYLRLRSPVGHSLAAGPSALSFDLAIANYAGATTGGGALGLNPVNGEVLLYLEVPCALMDRHTLETVLGRFLEAALHWCDRLQASPAPVHSDAVDAPLQAWVRA